MDMVLVKLVDPLPKEHDAALHTLGQVCSSTGYVVGLLWITLNCCRF